jgi:hypothetical protein
MSIESFVLPVPVWPTMTTSFLSDSVLIFLFTSEMLRQWWWRKT